MVVGAKQSSNNGATNTSTDTKTHRQPRPACQDSSRSNQDHRQNTTANLPLAWCTHTCHFPSLSSPIPHTLTTTTATILSSQLACLSNICYILTRCSVCVSYKCCYKVCALRCGVPRELSVVKTFHNVQILRKRDIVW